MKENINQKVVFVDEIIKDFFVEDEKKFRIEDVMGLIVQLSKYSKLIGREGRVQILNKDLSGTNKLKVFLVTRFLGSKLGELKPELNINPNIKEISIENVAEFLGVSKDNCRARMSALVSEGFAKRSKLGSIEVENFKIEGFLKELQEQLVNKTNKSVVNQGKIQKKKASKVSNTSKKEKLVIDEKPFFSLLSENLNIEESKLKDSIYILPEEGVFKYHEVPGKSKIAKQKSVILSSSYLLLIGLGKKNFNTRLMTKICFNSAVDFSDMKYAIYELKKDGLIGKAGAGVSENILREAGKEEARKVIKEICKA